MLPTVKEKNVEKIIESTDTASIFCMCKMPEYSYARSIEYAPISRMPCIVGILRLRCVFYRLRKMNRKRGTYIFAAKNDSRWDDTNNR